MIPALLFFVTASRLQPDAPAAAPFRQPQVVVSGAQTVLTFGAGPAIYLARSSSHSVHFDQPVKIVEAPGLMLGRHRGPRIALLKQAWVVSAIAGGDLRTWRSTDRGHTWKPGPVINDVPNAAREGLHSMTAGPKGKLFAAWLDLRAKGTRLYGAESDDAGLTWKKNVLVYESPDGTICTCCHPTAQYDKDGALWVMWRNATDGSRDFYIRRSPDGQTFEPPFKLGAGTWKLNTCPMDGGGFAATSKGIVSAWRREDTVFLAAPDQSEKALSKGKDVALAVTRRGSFVAWTKGEGVEIWLPGATQPSVLSDHGAFVTLTGLPSGAVLAAWENNGAIEYVELSRTPPPATPERKMPTTDLE